MPLYRCENFVKFGPVTPELTGLIGKHQVQHGQKTGAFSQISADILHRFSQYLWQLTYSDVTARFVIRPINLAVFFQFLLY